MAIFGDAVRCLKSILLFLMVKSVFSIVRKNKNNIYSSKRKLLVIISIVTTKKMANRCTVTADDVLKLTQPTDDFLCKLSDNTYQLDFLRFTIRDMASNKVVYDINREPHQGPIPVDLPTEVERQARTIRYIFPTSFLKLDHVGAKLVFAVGPQPVPNFRMIEQHYFRNKLIKSFDFTFGFCMPNSTNTWESIYDVPKLSPADEADIIAHPYQTRSDSFYFVNNVLVMHNKAEYAYTEEIS